MYDFLTPNMPDNLGHMTAIEWLLLQLLRHSVLRQSSADVAEAAASLPVSNAWPERGASILKVIKTKKRNRLSSVLMKSLMQVGINGPPVDRCSEVIKKYVKA